MQETELDPLIDAAMAASRALLAISTRSLGALEEEITPAQHRALVVLQSRGPQTSQALADDLGVVPSTATRMCDRLVAKGLVDRTVPEDDRRVVRLEVSRAGTQLVARVTAARRAELREALERMVPADRRAFVRSLRAFAEAAGEVPDDAWPPVRT